MTRQLVLARHGQSEFNARNLFTGWADPGLTAQGVEEAERVAARLRERHVHVQAAFCSALRRTRECADIVLRDLDASAALIADPALNERDYGDLTGLDKTEAAARWGAAQVRKWRRGYSDVPPGGESLRDTVARVLPFYIQQILPTVMRSHTSLVVAHGNSLRALVMALEGLSKEAIADVELATGEVRLYQLNADTTVASREVLSA